MILYILARKMIENKKPKLAEDLIRYGFKIVRKKPLVAEKGDITIVIHRDKKIIEAYKKDEIIMVFPHDYDFVHYARWKKGDIRTIKGGTVNLEFLKEVKI